MKRNRFYQNLGLRQKSRCFFRKNRASTQIYKNNHNTISPAINTGVAKTVFVSSIIFSCTSRGGAIINQHHS